MMMAARLRIEDGNPIWLADSIRPSRDVMVSVAVPPTVAAVDVNSTDVFVYVKTENTGTQDLGVCACTNAGRWPDAVPFVNVYGGAGPTTSANPRGAGILRINPTAGDVLDLGGGTTVMLGPPTTRRAWDWSPDGRFLGYAAAGTMTVTGGAVDWTLSVLALQFFTRADMSTVPAGGVIVSELSNGPWIWTQANFRWAGSSAVLASGPGDPIKPPLVATVPPLQWRLLCPAAPAGGNVWRDVSPLGAGANGNIDRWLYLPSPCESVIALTPNLSAQATEDIRLVSLSTASRTTFKRNNLPVTVQCVATAPKITTAAHVANGVSIDIGNGLVASFVTVDDPDCTAIAQSAQVVVDRVKASTLPTANLGVLAVGQASAGPLAVGAVKWVQVPNMIGWANQSEPHWCLLAQAFTLDGTTIPRPWDGQAATPPPFPLQDENCAQRNIMIS
jgi:hypothetical protein